MSPNKNMAVRKNQFMKVSQVDQTLLTNCDFGPVVYHSELWTLELLDGTKGPNLMYLLFHELCEIIL
jgi:hypothetical protein